MAIKRRIQTLTLWVLFGVFSFVSGNALAGGYELLPPNPWMFYVGAFGGYYHAAYQYEPVYLNPVSPVRNQLFNSDIRQRGMLWGRSFRRPISFCASLIL